MSAANDAKGGSINTASAGTEGQTNTLPGGSTPVTKPENPFAKKTEKRPIIREEVGYVGKTPEISYKTQERLHEFVREYNRTTRAMMEGQNEYRVSTIDQAVLQLGEALDKRAEALKEKRPIKEVLKARDKTLFYDLGELNLVLGVLENTVLEETSALAYRLTENGNRIGVLSVPRKLKTEVGGAGSDALDYIFDGLSMIGAKLNVRLDPAKISFELKPVSEHWESNRMSASAFKSKETDTQEDNIVGHQHLRYEIYKGLGFDIYRAQDLYHLKLDPEVFDQSGSLGKGEINLHRRISQNLQKILETEFPGKTMTEIPPDKRIEIMLKARNQGISESLTDECTAILQQEGTTDDVRVKELEKKVTALEKAPGFTPDEVTALQTAFQRAEAEKTAAEQLVQLYEKLVASNTEPESISSATDAHQAARAIYNALEARHGAFITAIENLPEPLHTAIERLNGDIEQWKQQRETAIQAGNNQLYDQLTNSINTNQAQVKTLESQQRSYDEKVTKLTEAKNALDEAERVMNRRNTKKTEIETTIRDALNQQQFNLSQKNDYINLIEARRLDIKKQLEQAQANKPSSENEHLAKLYNKLHDAISKDYNRIIEAVLTGKKGAQLKDLSDLDTGYDAFIELLFHSNAEAEDTSPEIRQGLLSRFELARFISQFHGVDISQNTNLLAIRQQDELVNQAFETYQRTQTPQDKLNFETAVKNAQLTRLQSGNNLLREMLPQVGIHGRVEAGELIQFIFEQKLAEASNNELGRFGDVRLFKMREAPGKSVRMPIEVEPGEVRITSGTEGRNLIDDMERVSIRDRGTIKKFREAFGIKEDFSDAVFYRGLAGGTDIEHGFLIEKNGKIIYIQRAKANQALFNMLPPDYRETMKRWQSKHLADHFFEGTSMKKRDAIDDQWITSEYRFSNFDDLVNKLLNQEGREISSDILTAMGNFYVNLPPAEKGVYVFNARNRNFSLHNIAQARNFNFTIVYSQQEKQLRVTDNTSGQTYNTTDFLTYLDNTNFTQEERRRALEYIGLATLEGLRQSG